MVYTENTDFPNDVRPCPCRACEGHRRYQQLHPEKHLEHVKAYYNRNQEKILMQKAYKRYITGHTKKLHKQTLLRLENAGFLVPPDTASTSNLESFKHEIVPNMVATEVC